MTKTKQIEREHAKLLFTREFLTQKEIAERLGVSEKTISKWSNDENWKHLRQSMVLTKDEQLANLYGQLDELNSDIKTRPEGKRYASNKESDTISKIASSIARLETETSTASIVEVSRKLLNYVRSIDLDKAKDFSAYVDAFIRHTLKH